MCVCVFSVYFSHSFYPLYPPFCRENDGVSHDHTPYTASSTEINFDLRVAYESGRVSLPILPDLLVLTSDLKPFTKACSIACVLVQLFLFTCICLCTCTLCTLCSNCNTPLTLV